MATTSSSIHALIAYDGSSGAGDALRAAAQLFPGARATVLFAPDESSMREHAEFARIAVPDGGLAEAMQTHADLAFARARERTEHGTRLADRAGLHATAETWPESSAWRAIVRAAEDLDVDVIVCGSRGRGPISRGLLGSTSLSVLHHAHRPVLIVPPGSGDLDGPTAIAYDGSEGARAAIRAAARLLPHRPAIVTCAWASPLRTSSVGEELAGQGATLASDAGLTARIAAVDAKEGASRALIASARSEGAAVLVTGSRGRGPIASALLGSVSGALVHDARLPVLVVR